MKFGNERRKKISELLGNIGLLVTGTLIVGQLSEGELSQTTIFLAVLTALALFVGSVLVIQEE